jgi:acetyl esterase
MGVPAASSSRQRSYVGTVLRTARKKLGAAIVDQLFLQAATWGTRLPMADPHRHGVHRERDVRYLPTGSADHTLDIFRPAGLAGPLPVVVYVHGGAFRALSKDTHLLMATAYARRGCLVYNVNYRLSPRHKYPAGLCDLIEAYKFAMEHAAQHGGDLSRVVLAGESAGANLSASLSAALCYERPEHFAQRAFAIGVVPKAVVAACGVFQVTNGERFRVRHGDHWFWNDRYSEMEEDYLPRPHARAIGPGECALADPLCILESSARPVRPLPAFFMPCGGEDHLRWDTLRMSAALSRLDVPHEARIYAGEIHAFHAFVITRAARACWRDTFLFLERHGVTGLKRGPMSVIPQGWTTATPARRAA